MISEERWREALWVAGFENETPADTDPYDSNDLAGSEDWPEWPAQQMLSWMPKAIRERIGNVGVSMVSGPALSFPLQKETEVVSALENAGYICRRDDKLVAAACFGALGSVGRQSRDEVGLIFSTADCNA